MEYRVLNEKELKKLNYENCFGVGCFEEECIGYIILRDYRFIIDLYAKDNLIKDRLIDLILFYSSDECVSNIEDHIFFKKGFVLENNALKYKRDLYNFKNYDEVHEFISQQKDRVYSLDNFKRFMNDFGNPQYLLNCIHVGGTNGKGSTTNYIRSVLQKANYKVGTFTSPVLITRREVMKVNNEMISEDEIISIANRYMKYWLDYEISMFEIEVFISVLFFIYHHVDYVVYEVGLGGELDATNIINSLISIITNIGLDHTEYLGNTYRDIAATKSGIIKKNSLFVTNEKKEECLDVFESVCIKNNTQYHRCDEPKNIKCDNLLEFDYKNYHIILNTQAFYQSENCSLAVEALCLLRTNGLARFSDEHLMDGLKETCWPGRFEVVNHNPLIIIDGAHNKEGMKAFVESAKRYNNVKIIFSALKDKDTQSMIEQLLSVSEDVTVCEFDFYRAQKAELLAMDYPVKIEKNWMKAVDDVYSFDGTVFITGSLYFIAKVREYIKSRN